MSGAPIGVLEQLNQASSAEDFFALLGVDYDPKHVNVVRLHILRRMGQYLVSEDFTGVNKGMLENFNKGNISILEFLDFFESFNAAVRQVNQLQRRRAISFEELQYVIGTAIKS